MSTAIVEVQTAVAEFDRVAAGIADLKAKFGGVVYDVAISKGMEAAKEARAAIREPRYEIERVRKEAKAPILKLGKELDDRAKAITADILAIEKPIDDQIKNEEARKEAEKQAKADAELKRVSDLQERVAYLGGSTNLTSLDDPALIAEHISDLQSEVVDESFEEYRERADAAKATGIARLQALHAAAVERVTEAERIKAERAELAKLRAEQEARDKAERERLAEEERKAKVERDAETARQAAELKAQREKQDAEAAAERKRIAEEEAAAKAIRDADAKKLGEERAAFERQQAEARAIQAADEAKRKEQARVAALVRPDDAEMIDVLAIHYNAPASRVVEWILSIDFSSEQIKELAAA